MHYVIGDIHGQRKMLEEMLNTIKYDPGRDSLYFLGDYVDWGPDSMGVLRLLMTLQKESANVGCILGNHDLMMLRSLQRPLTMSKAFRHLNDWSFNRGIETYEQYLALPKAEQDEIREWLEKLPCELLITVDGQKYCLTHGVPECAVKEGTFSRTGRVREAVWRRLEYGEDLKKTCPELSDYIIIKGHQITDSLRVEFWEHDMILLDCGAKAIGVLKGDYKLACIRIEDRKVFYAGNEDNK